MNKIYAFLIILPIIALVFFKTMAFYEYDTKQRYIKNTIDITAHKVMITGVLTAGEKDELVNKLNKLENFQNQNIILLRGEVEADGAITGESTYIPGSILKRGEVFSIIVQSKEESMLSRMEDSVDETRKLYYKAKATCRVEKYNEVE